VFDIKALGDGRFVVDDGTMQRVVYAVQADGTRWVFVHGHTYVLVEPSATRRRAHDDDHALGAPMPATVSSIKVTLGEHVSRGDVLVMLEAMKMELPIKAPRDGRVKSIACSEGELVQPGVPLLELE
jgi:biotin carboxyl carrier protein